MRCILTYELISKKEGLKMGVADDMKRVTEDIIASYDVRVRADLAEASKIWDEMNKTLRIR
ncbi:MAG: hypothetical protein AB1478_10720 [Nitrospirota bacterium]